jgi:tetratricopeptide (TPR) repeat protein
MDERTRETIRDLVARGREHYAARDYEKAERVLSEVLREKVAYADVYDMLGVIYHQQGRLSEAESMFQEALRINPSYTEAALNLAVTCNDLGKYREAKEVYQRAMTTSRNAPRRLDPFAKGKIANMHAEVGAAYHAVGLYEDAVREYQRALALCPGFADIRTRLGTTLREMGNTQEAIGEFERVRGENPRYVAARLHLGLSYYAAGRKEEAESEWREVLALAPGNKSAEMYLTMLHGQPGDGSSGGQRGEDH